MRRVQVPSWCCPAFEVRRRITAELETSDALPLIHALENRLEARLKAFEKGVKPPSDS